MSQTPAVVVRDLHVRFGDVEAVSGVDLSADSGQATALLGRADAADVLVEPLADGAERVVVERVHHRSLEAVRVGPAVPALPDRRRAVPDGVAPGGEGVVQQESVGDIVVAVRGEGGAEVADADEAGNTITLRAKNSEFRDAPPDGYTSLSGV